jgi:O-antigen ligase
MMPPLTWRPGDKSWIAACLAAAMLISLLFPLTAFRFGALALPGALIGAALLIATVPRPEIGIATALVLVPVGNLGLVGLGVLQSPPWIPVALWVAFVFVVVLLQLVGRSEHYPRLGGALIFLWAVTLVGFGLAENQTDAMPILRAVTVGLIFFFTIALYVRDRRAVGWVLGGIGVSAALVGAVASYQFFSGAPAEEGFFADGEVITRALGGFGHPNELGGFLVILVPFLMAAALMQRRGRSLYVAALLLAVLGIYASFSRGALLGLAAIPLFFIPRRQMAYVLPVFVALVLLATPNLVRERFETLSGQESDVATRVDFWRTAEDIWHAHPILGVGVGGYPQAYAESKLPGKRFLPNTVFQPPPDAHNLYLNQLAETGLLGLIALLVVLVLALRASLQLRRSRLRWLKLMGNAALASLVAFSIHNLFDVTLLEGTSMFFFGILGLLAALLVIAERGEAASRATGFGPPAAFASRGSPST